MQQQQKQQHCVHGPGSRHPVGTSPEGLLSHSLHAQAFQDHGRNTWPSVRWGRQCDFKALTDHRLTAVSGLILQ